jgi:hypothetical protein
MQPTVRRLLRSRAQYSSAVSRVASSLLALGCVTAAAAVPTAHAADRAARVPWRQAGPGWSVAEYSAASLHGGGTARTVFYLVSPSGHRYPFYSTPSATAYPELALLDWSGDRRRILVYRDDSGGTMPIVMEQISLVTGTVVSQFKLPATVLPQGYTRPGGASILAAGFGKPGIYRYTLTGRLQRVLAHRTRLGIFKTLDAPAGGFLLAGTVTRLLRITSSGAITRRIRIPGSELCAPARWWTATTALVNCFGTVPYRTERLWLVPAGSGTPKPLTPALRPHGQFFGYVDAWTTDGGLYLQADDDTSTLSIVRQSADGARHSITVPGPAGVSDAIITAYRGQLMLQSNIGGPGGPSSLFWFNPVTRSVRFIVRARPATYGVYGVIPYGYWNQ